MLLHHVLPSLTVSRPSLQMSCEPWTHRFIHSDPGTVPLQLLWERACRKAPPSPGPSLSDLGTSGSPHAPPHPYNCWPSPVSLPLNHCWLGLAPLPLPWLRSLHFPPALHSVLSLLALSSQMGRTPESPSVYAPDHRPSGAPGLRAICFPLLISTLNPCFSVTSLHRLFPPPGMPFLTHLPGALHPSNPPQESSSGGLLGHSVLCAQVPGFPAHGIHPCPGSWR